MSALCLTAGSTKYFGTAKARYDFCARDRSELSLKEGDIIKILNKKGQQGWWRGEIYGRVSWGGAQQSQWGCPGWWTGEGGQGGVPGWKGGRDRDFMYASCSYLLSTYYVPFCWVHRRHCPMKLIV